jgi:hypothetical protein
MADISITATSVTASLSLNVTTKAAGATIVAGQTVYLDASTGRWLLADSDAVIVAARTPAGVALNGGSINQPVAVKSAGPVTMNAVLTAGTGYYQSGTPGGIAPIADQTTGDLLVLIGFAASTTVLNVAIAAAPVVL